MQTYKIYNHGVPIEFQGRLLSHTDTRNSPEREQWSEFQIFYTDEKKFVVYVKKCYSNGEENGRSFFCDDLYIVQSVLTHPGYGKINFRAQNAYNIARRKAEEHGLIQKDAFLLELDEEGKPIIPELSVNGFPQEYEDFDFSED